MDFDVCNNPFMDISARIAHNLSAWMETSLSLNTLKKVAAKSQAGFGTVQRAKNGTGNITVEKLELIAQAFGRQAIDLITEPMLTYEVKPSLTIVKANEPSLEEQRLIEGFRHVDPKDRETILFLTDRALADFTERSGND